MTCSTCCEMFISTNRYWRRESKIENEWGCAWKMPRHLLLVFVLQWLIVCRENGSPSSCNVFNFSAAHAWVALNQWTRWHWHAGGALLMTRYGGEQRPKSPPPPSGAKALTGHHVTRSAITADSRCDRPPEGNEALARSPGIERPNVNAAILLHSRLSTQFAHFNSQQNSFHTRNILRWIWKSDSWLNSPWSIFHEIFNNFQS